MLCTRTCFSHILNSTGGLMDIEKESHALTDRIEQLASEAEVSFIDVASGNISSCEKKLREVLGSNSQVSHTFSRKGSTVRFKTPVYVDYVIIKTQNPIKKPLKVEGFGYRNGESFALDQDWSNDEKTEFQYSYEGFLSGLKLLERFKAIESKSQVTEVSIFGFRDSNLEKVETMLAERHKNWQLLKDETKNYLATIQQKKDELIALQNSHEEEITSLEEQKQELNSQIEELDENKTSAEKEHSQVLAKLESQKAILTKTTEDIALEEEKLEKIKSNIEIKNQEKDDLSTNLSQLRADIQKLKSHKSLFPENMEGLSSSRKIQSAAYFGIVLACIYSITEVFPHVTEHMMELWGGVSPLSSESGLAFLYSRVPYALLWTAVISAIGTLAYYAFKKLVYLNDFQLSVGVVNAVVNQASEITQAELDGLDSQEAYEFNMRLKFSRIRSLLPRDAEERDHETVKFWEQNSNTLKWLLKKVGVDTTKISGSIDEKTAKRLLKNVASENADEE